MPPILDLYNLMHWECNYDEIINKGLLENEKVCELILEHEPYNIKFMSNKIKNCKRLCLIAVRRKGCALEYLSNQMKDDEEICATAIKTHGDAYIYASKRIRNKIKFAKMSLLKRKYHNYAIDFIKFYDDIDFCKMLINHSTPCVSKIIKRHSHNYDLCECIANTRKGTIEHFSPIILSDIPFIKKILSIDGNLIRCLSNNLKNDKELCMIAVSNCGMALKYLSKKMQNDYDICYAAITNDIIAFKYCSIQLRSTYDFCEYALSIDGNDFEYLSGTLHQNENLCILAAQTCKYVWYYIESINKQLSDRIFRFTVNNNPGTIFSVKDTSIFSELEICSIIDKIIDFEKCMPVHLSEFICRNKEICKTILKHNLDNIRDFDKKILSDPEIWEFLANSDAPFHHESVYHLIPDSIKNNEDICKKLIKKDPNFLRYMSDSIKNNKDIYKMAVSRRGAILADVPNEIMRNDEEICASALYNCVYGGAVNYISDELKNSEHFLAKFFFTNKKFYRYVPGLMDDYPILKYYNNAYRAIYTFYNINEEFFNYGHNDLFFDILFAQINGGPDGGPDVPP